MDGVPDWDMGHQNWTGATGRGHRRGQESRPSPLYLLFPLETLSPSHPLRGHIQAQAVTLLENWGISWKVALDLQFPPSGRNCCPHVAPSLDLGPFLAKIAAFARKNPSGWSQGGWSPREMVESPPSPIRF